MEGETSLALNLTLVPPAYSLIFVFDIFIFEIFIFRDFYLSTKLGLTFCKALLFFSEWYFAPFFIFCEAHNSWTDGRRKPTDLLFCSAFYALQDAIVENLFYEILLGLEKCRFQLFRIFLSLVIDENLI